MTINYVDQKCLFCKCSWLFLFIFSPKGEGYNCRTNRSSGDGLWSNVVSQRDWVLGHISDNIIGEKLGLNGGGC